LSPERLAPSGRQGLEQHTRHPLATALLEERLCRQYRCWRWRTSRHLCRGRACRQIRRSMGFVGSAKPGCWRAGRYGTRREDCWPSRVLPLESPGGHRSAVAAADGVLGLVGVGRPTRPRRRAHPRGAQAMGWTWRSSAAISGQAVRRLGAELGLSKRPWPGSCCLSRSWSSWLSLAASGGRGDVGDGIKRMPLPLAAADLAFAWRRAPRIARTQPICDWADSVSTVSRPSPWPATRFGQGAPEPGLGVRLQPGEAALAPGCSAPGFGLLLSPSVGRLCMRHQFRFTVVAQRPVPAWSPRRPPRQGRFLVLEGHPTAVASRPSSSSFPPVDVLPVGWLPAWRRLLIQPF